MRIDDAKKFLKIIVEKQVPVAPLFVGIMGIGKSEIVKQVANELHVDFVDLRLAQMEPGDLIGIPYRDGDKTKWAAPSWFPKEGTRGIIHLDELNRAPNDVRQTVFQLIWDKQMHTHKLPKGWIVASSINPPGGEYQTEELDKAMLRRFIVLSLEPNTDVWLNWAMRDGNIDSKITGFIGTHKNMLFKEESFDIPVERNNAGWVVVDTLNKANAIPKDLEFEIVSGIVGKEAAMAYRKYVDENYERPVTGESVLKDYQEVRERVLKQKIKNDETILTISELVALIEKAKKLTKKQSENVSSFFMDLSADMQAMFVQRLPAEIVSELGKDDRIVDTIGKIMTQVNKDKKNV